MPHIDPQLSTGLLGLDRVLKGLIPGDNLIFQVDNARQYSSFATPVAQYGARHRQKVAYFRFASHSPLIEEQEGVEIFELDPDAGFEPFITEIHDVIRRFGRGGYYIFDCLTELADAWYSDQMLGNFFMLTCPRLYDVAAIAYFAVLHNCHSQHALAAIMETTQIFIDVLDHKGRLYIQPIKVQQRYSSSMHTIHVRQERDFIPLTQSAAIAEVRAASSWSGFESFREHLNIWNRSFIKAAETQKAIQKEELPPEAADKHFARLLRMTISRDKKMLRLAERHLTLDDLLKIGARMVGTGLIGGKSVGMLLARAILKQEDERWNSVLEPHDSFYIGSDVFYSFLVTNGIWWLRQQRNLEMLLEGAITARQRMIVGGFPEIIISQLEDMLDYFGQSPIIVRSSSLLEDNYGNAFAGKYESVFCVNQGPRHKRLEDLLSAIRSIYASAMSEEALKYRARRGMLDCDEQMSLLVQRVSGAMHNHLFYPHIAGVGLSFNPYVWNDKIDPDAGVLRMVFGMGTRAVDYQDDDYTRIVALNSPLRQPAGDSDDAEKHSQRDVDLLDLESNQLISMDWRAMAEKCPDLPLHLLCSRDARLTKLSRQPGRENIFPYVITFEKLLADTDFTKDMRAALNLIERAYDYPVDIEFTANFLSDDEYRINIVQCRPFQCAGSSPVPQLPDDLSPEQIIVESQGAVIGKAREIGIDRIIYIVPHAYADLANSDKYSIARLMGRATRACSADGRKVMLIGPGRWGTSTPSLGVPVSFSEIDTVSVLGEVVAMHTGLVPDVSLGTHIFNEMVEMDILYFALFPDCEDNYINTKMLESAPNLLPELLPSYAKLRDTVRIIASEDIAGDARLLLNADTKSRRATCYIAS